MLSYCVDGASYVRGWPGLGVDPGNASPELAGLGVRGQPGAGDISLDGKVRDRVHLYPMADYAWLLS